MRRESFGDSASWEKLDVGVQVDEIFTVVSCPVCGAKTLDNHYICVRCLWEYDGSLETEYSSANKMTLEKYKLKYYRGERLDV